MMNVDITNTIAKNGVKACITRRELHALLRPDPFELKHWLIDHGKNVKQRITFDHLNANGNGFRIFAEDPSNLRITVELSKPTYTLNESEHIQNVYAHIIRLSLLYNPNQKVE
jgi:hypothetical protein